MAASVTIRPSCSATSVATRSRAARRCGSVPRGHNSISQGTTSSPRGHAFLPIVQHSCFVQTILHSPQPYVTQPLENSLPDAASVGQAAVFLPFLPHRQEYSQRNLVREQHEQAPTEGLVGASFSAVRDFKEIVIRRNIRFLDLGKPFHSRDLLYRADEMLDRVDGLQDNDFLGNEVVGLGLHPHASCFQRLLQSVELRIQPFGLPCAARKVVRGGDRDHGTRQSVDLQQERADHIA